MNNPPKKYTKVNGVVKINPEYKRWKEAFGDEQAEGQSNKVTKVQINLYASKLKNVAGIGKGTSDPFAVVTLLANNPDDTPKIIGKTEVVKNNLSPRWTSSFILDYSLGVSTRINVGIFDEIKKGNKAKPMGSQIFELGEVLGSRGNVKAKKLKLGGTLFVHAMAAATEDAGRLMLKLQGHKLKNVEGMFSKSDPFCEISAKVNSAGGLTWQPVFRSKHIDNNLNPIWEEMDLNMNKLCQGDRSAPILVAVYDWEKSGKHRSMGSFETTVNALLSSAVTPGSGKHVDTSKAYSLYKQGKDYGKIVVTGATVKGGVQGPAFKAVTGVKPTPRINMPAPPLSPNSRYQSNRNNNQSSRNNNSPPLSPTRQYGSQRYASSPPRSPMATAMGTSSAAVATAVVMGQEQARNPSYGSLPPVIASSPMAIPAMASRNRSTGSYTNNNPGRRPKFVDYLTGGCELQMCVAIDFTGSNGDPRKPGTLHYIHRDGVSLNDYEKAITAVGGVVARYDSDQKFPVWGFGAKFHGIINHCFQVGPAAELSGISGILDGYRQVFRTGLTMSGPTVFADVIQKAAYQARTVQADRARVGKQAYHILLILTDGAVTDVEQTKRALLAASDAPLSIIIVGIGNADFSTMQFLDDLISNDSGGGRDITQFVEFSKYQYNRQNLTKETLDEVPDQLVDYFYDTQGIMPLPALSGSKLSVMESEYADGDDIDINLEFEEGEITIVNPESGIIDDTQYDTYTTHAAGGAAPMGMAPPPMAPPVQSVPVQAMPVPQPQVFQVQVPPNGYPGMQLQVQNPFTRQSVLVTVPNGVQAGQTFAVA